MACSVTDEQWAELVAAAMGRAAALEAAQEAVAAGMATCRPDAPGATSADQPTGDDPFAVSAWLSERAAREVTAGRGIQLADGDYATVLPVRSRHWVAQLEQWLTTPEGQAARRRCKVGADMVRWVAVDEADHADYATGREVRTSNASVAQRISARPDVLAKRPRGISATAVHRVRWFLDVTGWEQTIRTGRYLTSAERAAAQRRHGRRQLLGASVRSLTTPTGQALVRERMTAAETRQRRRYDRLKKAMGTATRACAAADSSRQPRSGVVTRSLQGSSGNQARERARAARTTARSTHEPIPLPAQRLAAGLLARVPRLRQAPTRPLAREVAPLAARGWTVHDVLAVIDAYDREHDLPPISVAAQRNPLGLLVHRIRRACSGAGAAPSATPRPDHTLGLRLPAVTPPQDRDRTDCHPPTSSPAYTARRATKTLPNQERSSITDINLAAARRRGSLGSRWHQSLIDTGGVP